jgi:hypothetical protein
MAVKGMRMTRLLVVSMALAAAFSAALAPSTPFGTGLQARADKQIILIAGKPSHGPGEHEFHAGSLLLQKALSGYPGVLVQVVSGGWPTKVVDGATVDEVARALVVHEKNFKEEILQAALGLGAREIPPLHIGEFGVGRGGLKHPNLWDGAATPAEESQLAREIARGVRKALP